MSWIANNVCASDYNWRAFSTSLPTLRGGTALALVREPMKWLGLVAVLGACSESGAHITLSAPNGPGEATAFKLILATPETIPQIANQRVGLSDDNTQTVPYFLQRTIAGADEIDHVDGLRIRLAPDVTTDSKFIPFVLLYDSAGSIVGVATFHAAGSSEPAPVLVMPDEIDMYVLDVEPVTQVTDDVASAPGQVLVVECSDDAGGTFTSGIAWRPLGGGELRLLFPADGGDDATGRELDLDCDQHVVTEQSSGRDCDDTRGWFNRDAQEMCDGYDTNCDGQRTLLVACAGPNGTVCPDPTTGMGNALCDDRTGQMGQCMSDVQCLCANQQTGCTRCLMEYAVGTTTTNIAPCQPGVGPLSLSTMCAPTEPCTVEVIAVRGGWKAEVASDLVNPSFGSAASGVGAKVMLKVKRPEGPGFEMTKQFSLGEVDLLITTKDGSTHFKAIDLGPVGDAPVTCAGSGPFTLYCSP